MTRLTCTGPPLFAVLDEASAAVSVDIESDLLCACHDRGITMISVSHRHHLRRFHRTVMRVLGDGEGGWATQDISGQVQRTTHFSRPRTNSSWMVTGKEGHHNMGRASKHSAGS